MNVAYGSPLRKQPLAGEVMLHLINRLLIAAAAGVLSFRVDWRRFLNALSYLTIYVGDLVGHIKPMVQILYYPYQL